MQEKIYILSAVDINKKTNDTLHQEFEIMKIQYPLWNKKTYEDFLEWKTECHESRFAIETYDTAYFLDINTARKYAEENMADINESGAYPWLVIYTRPLNQMYADSESSEVWLFEYDRDTDRYNEITNFSKNIKYRYIKATFDIMTKYPEEKI